MMSDSSELYVIDADLIVLVEELQGGTTGFPKAREYMHVLHAPNIHCCMRLM